MRRTLFGIAILSDLTATALLIVGLLCSGTAALGSASFVAVLAVLWISAGIALVLALRQ
jgi:hypothetical protein